MRRWGSTAAAAAVPTLVEVAGVPALAGGDAAAVAAAAEHAVDDPGGAADAGAHGERPRRAVERAGAALDAGVRLAHGGEPVLEGEHVARADADALAAAGAGR